MYNQYMHAISNRLVGTIRSTVPGQWAGDKNPCFTALFIIDCRSYPSATSVNFHYAGEAYMMRLIKRAFAPSHIA